MCTSRIHLRTSDESQLRGSFGSTALLGLATVPKIAVLSVLFRLRVSVPVAVMGLGVAVGWVEDGGAGGAREGIGAGTETDGSEVREGSGGGAECLDRKDVLEPADVAF